MSQIEVPKLVEHALVGSESDEIAVPKLIMYVLAAPGGGEDSTNRQGHVWTQIVRRKR